MREYALKIKTGYQGISLCLCRFSLIEELNLKSNTCHGYDSVNLKFNL